MNKCIRGLVTSTSRKEAGAAIGLARIATKATTGIQSGALGAAFPTLSNHLELQQKQQVRFHHPSPFDPQTTKGWAAAKKVRIESTYFSLFFSFFFFISFLSSSSSSSSSCSCSSDSAPTSYSTTSFSSKTRKLPFPLPVMTQMSNAVWRLDFRVLPPFKIGLSPLLAVVNCHTLQASIRS